MSRRVLPVVPLQAAALPWVKQVKTMLRRPRRVPLPVAGQPLLMLTPPRPVVVPLKKPTPLVKTTLRRAAPVPVQVVPVVLLPLRPALRARRPAWKNSRTLTTPYGKPSRPWVMPSLT